MFSDNFTYAAFAARRSSPGLAALPEDVLLVIASHLDSSADIAHLCLTSKSISDAISSSLYANVRLQTLKQCQTTLGMLQKSPTLARHVRRLTVDPKPSDDTHPSTVHPDCSTELRVTALSKVLVALQSFEWHGAELPVDDAMWFALRISCPQLRYISTTIGSRLPDVQTSLFSFQNLLGFSFCPNPNFATTHEGTSIPDDDPATQRVWKMLRDNCPDLENLTVGDRVSPFPNDVHFLIGAHWPKLRNLTLGNAVVDWDHRPPVPGEKRPFIKFLEDHPTLQSLTLSPRSILAAHLETLAADSLPLLREFHGTLAQLQSLPQIMQLETVTIREDLGAHESYQLATSGMIKGLSSLRELNLSFLMETVCITNTLLKALVASCPQLHHLSLYCGKQPSIHLDSLSRSMRGFKNLRSLDLTIVHHPRETSTLAATATEIAKVNLQLEKINLALIPPRPPPVHVSSMGDESDVNAFVESTEMEEKGNHVTGSYTLSRDQNGTPQTMVAIESRESRSLWPFSWERKMKRRRYELDLRPGSVSRADLLTIITEKTRAGEELRFLTICGTLTSVMMFGAALIS